MNAADTGAALLEAIKADPGDDLPRLAYADWLEETGGDAERAEFVRLQMRLAGAQRAIDARGGLVGSAAAQAVRMRRQSREALARNPGWSGAPEQMRDVCLPGRWCGDEADAVRDDESALLWWRGFVAEVRCTLAEWLYHGDGIAKAHPLEKVTLAGKKPAWTETTRGGRWFFGPLRPERQEPEYSYQLPVPLLMAMRRAFPECKPPRPRGGPEMYANECHFPAESDAQDALSRACVLWGRAE